MPPETVFIGVDWRNLEGRLTAYFSDDATLLTALEDELKPDGIKVHSLNAATIYGIDPLDAKTHTVNLQGVERPAYDAGKRLTHAWNYGMETFEMAKQFWITRNEAERISDALSAAYPGVVRWRSALADHVFGLPKYICPNCDYIGQDLGECPSCQPNGFATKPRLRWNGYVKEPARILYTPFKRRRIYLGRRGQSANAVTAQLPQSTGASMWYRTLTKLTYWIAAVEGIPVETVQDLARQHPHVVYTGTYDSFLIGAPANKLDEYISEIQKTMERSWNELPLLHPCSEEHLIYRDPTCTACTPYKNDRGNQFFYCPSEAEVGPSWGELKEKANA